MSVNDAFVAERARHLARAKTQKAFARAKTGWTSLLSRRPTRTPAGNALSFGAGTDDAVGQPGCAIADRARGFPSRRTGSLLAQFGEDRPVGGEDR